MAHLVSLFRNATWTQVAIVATIINVILWGTVWFMISLPSVEYSQALQNLKAAQQVEKEDQKAFLDAGEKLRESKLRTADALAEVLSYQ